MINDSFSPEDQALIQQIQSTPRLEIGAAARDAIRQRMLTEFRGVQQQTAIRAAQTRVILLAVTAVIVIVAVVIAIIVFRGGPQNTEAGLTATPIPLSATPQATVTLTLIPTETATKTITPTATVTPPTITQTQIEGSISATPVPTLGSAVIVSQTPLPAANTPTSQPVLTSAAIIPSATSPGTPVSLTTAPASDSLIVIEGPVTQIVNNIITVYDFDIEVEAHHPILNLIEVGDIVRIEGAYGSTGNVIASVVSNVSNTPLVNGATVSLDGPVESINGRIIVVNGIAVQLAENDPLLQTVQVGQFVRVQGNFQGSGTTIVLVVVNIAVNVSTNTGNSDSNGDDSNCYWKESGMSGMGHWRCDDKGMGMGMGD